MAQSGYPNDDHSGGDLGSGEYERWATAVAETGLVGLPTDTSHGFVDGSTFAAKIRANKRAFVRGQLVDSGDTGVSFALTANSSGTTRIDMVVAGLDRSTGDASYYLVTGTPGAGQPAPQQDEDFDGTGKWELPVALYTVPNAATASTITCQPIGWYLGERIYLCTSSSRPPHRLNRTILETDTGKTLTSDGANWNAPVADDTDWVILDPWPTSNFSISAYARRKNGIAFVRGWWQRTAGTVGPNASWQLGFVPAGFRPGVLVPVAMVTSRGVSIRGQINADGGVEIHEYAGQIFNGDKVYVQSTSYPAQA